MKRRFQLKLLGGRDIEQVHRESLRILRELGVRFPHKDYLEAFKKMGARVDFDTEIVRFPAEVIEEALEIQRRNTQAYHRAHEQIDPNDYTQKFFMSGGNMRYLIEPGTFERRLATLRDMLQAIVIGNALQHVTRVSAFLIPSEYEAGLADIIQLYLLSLYSQKRYFFTYIYSLESARCLIDMARVVAEDDFQFRNGSLIEYELEPSGHLEFAREHLEIAAEFARRKMKIGTTHWSWMGYHTPLSYASLLALTNAHILAGTAAIIALNPENMYYRYIFPAHCVNRRDTSVPLMGSPHQVVFAWAARQLADFYGFPFCIANSGFSDALEDNFQSGFEVGVTAALSIAAGITCLGVKGVVGVDQGASLQRLVTDNEMMDYLNFVFSRSVDMGELALDRPAIEGAPRGGNFLASLQEGERLERAYWDSEIFFSGKYESWHSGISRESIRRRIESILRDHYPPGLVIAEGKVSELEAVMGSHVEDRSFVSRLRADLHRALAEDQ
jgi:trimethylamine--corrinoid protein Co-methyltransferase